ncbi:MAG TPA: tetratricopeptide repeat protein [Gemmataceae bacterium]|nr:tetratricopeptide repeat protein [Gemmataceae bacterium]
MATDLGAGGSWERVAAELRACRESQQRAWGDVDNATLGRYLAGELGGEERRQVEQALEALPELRKLTDLVRDVLVDCGPEVAPARTLTPAPEPAYRPLARPWRHSASLVSLATAAGLLLALGLSMPRLSDGAAARTARAPSLDGGVASRGESPVFFTAMRPAGPALSRQATAQEEGLARIEQMDRTVVSLEKKGKRKEALALAGQYADVARKADLELDRRYAYSLNQVCRLYLEEGDLSRAEPSLQQALALAKREFGPEHPTTAWARNRLADVYEVALNTPAPPRTNGQQVVRGSDPRMVPMAFPPSAAPQPLVAMKVTAAPTHMVASKDARPRAERERASAVVLRDRIARLGPRQVRSEVVPVLARALEDAPSPEGRQAAARALGELGPAASDALPALAARLQGAASPGERRALLLALRQIGPPARGLVQQLEQVAQVADDPLAREVFQFLRGREGRVGVNDGGACFSVRALRQSGREIRALAERGEVELMVETAPTLRPDAVQEAKGRLGEMGPRAVCVLIGKDGADVRVWVTDGLRRRGLATEPLTKLVAERCRDKDYDGALAAAIRFVAEQAKK